MCVRWAVCVHVCVYVCMCVTCGLCMCYVVYVCVVFVCGVCVCVVCVYKCEEVGECALPGLAPFPSTNCWQGTHRGCASISATPWPRGAQLCSLCARAISGPTSLRAAWEFQGNLVLGEMACTSGRGERRIRHKRTDCLLPCHPELQASVSA